MAGGHLLETPADLYIVVRGRLWRRSNPNLAPHLRERLGGELMDARRAVRAAKDDAEKLAAGRAAFDTAEIALGERGPVWWNDGAPDCTRHLAKNTPYERWFRTATRR